MYCVLNVVALLVEALRYKLDGRMVSQFFIDIILSATLWPCG